MAIEPGSALDQYNRNRYDSTAIFTMVIIIVGAVIAIYYLRKGYKTFLINQA